MTSRSSRWLLAILSVHFIGVHSDDTICAWYQPRVGTVRDTLYIDGGIPKNRTWDGAASKWSEVAATHWEPPAVLYGFKYGQKISYQHGPADLGEMLQQTYLTPTGAHYDTPLYRDGAMFVSDYELYTFGGIPVGGSSGSSKDTILNYKLFPVQGQTDFVTGGNLDSPLPSDVSNYIIQGAGVSVPSENLAFYFSGLRNKDGSATQVNTDPAKLEISTNMIKVDMTNPGEAKFTSHDLSSTSVPGRANAQLVWLPVSQQGILVAIGGVLYPQNEYDFNLSTEQTSESKDKSPGFMTNIGVYDIAADVWYTQAISGDTHPGQLSEFCAVAAGKPGDASFEIFIYGGDNGLSLPDSKPASDEVWVLSVPSFVWTRVGEADVAHARSGHYCSMPFPDQMLVFGGWNLMYDGSCIEDGSVMDVFNLNDLIWTKQYNSKSGGNYTTNASIKRTPAASLESGIAALFDASTSPYSTPILTWYPYKTYGGNSSTPVGAIAGGAAGGVAAILIGLIVWYCLRRRKRQQDQTESGTTSTLRNERVRGWRWNVGRPSVEVPVIPKDLGSETTTEVDPQLSPQPHAEVYGDYYFPQARTISPLPHGMQEVSPSRSPQRTSYHSGLARSPRSLVAGSLEADGDEVHEKDGKNSPLSDLGRGPMDFRQHPAYPYSIDRVASSDANSLSHSRQGNLGSNVSHVSEHSRNHSNNAPSPIPAHSSLHEVDNTHPAANDKGVDTVQPLRPTHHRNLSSRSSGFPITPPVIDENTSMDRPPLEMRMSATSGPISPMLNEEMRPAHHRHGSSLDSNLSGNIALPPPLNPTSPSVYSPEVVGTGSSNYTNATVGASTGANTTVAAASNVARAEESQSQSSTLNPLAGATLVGGGRSPMTEKINPLEQSVGSTVAGLRGQGTNNTATSGMRRKPVGGQRSAYEETRKSQGR